MNFLWKFWLSRRESVCKISFNREEKEKYTSKSWISRGDWEFLLQNLDNRDHLEKSTFNSPARDRKNEPFLLKIFSRSRISSMPDSDALNHHSFIVARVCGWWWCRSEIGRKWELGGTVMTAKMSPLLTSMTSPLPTSMTLSSTLIFRHPGYEMSSSTFQVSRNSRTWSSPSQENIMFISSIYLLFSCTIWRGGW